MRILIITPNMHVQTHLINEITAFLPDTIVDCYDNLTSYLTNEMNYHLVFLDINDDEKLFYACRVFKGCGNKIVVIKQGSFSNLYRTWQADYFLNHDIDRYELRHILSSLNNTLIHTVPLSTALGKVNINPRSIIEIVKHNGQSTFYTTNNHLDVSTHHLKKFLQANPRIVLRVNRSQYVNLHYIAKRKGSSLYLCNGHVAKISNKFIQEKTFFTDIYKN